MGLLVEGFFRKEAGLTNQREATFLVAAARKLSG